MDSSTRCLTIPLIGKARLGILAVMATFKITTKRQATLPASLCEELGVKPGDSLQAQRTVVDGQTVWVLRGRKPDWSWFGAAKTYGARKSHRWADVRESIDRGWRGGDRP